MKDISSFKTNHIFLIALLIASTMLLTSCFWDGSSNSSTTSNTQASAITPIGVPATCLTVHPPSLVMLPDKHYKLVDEINNCGGKIVGPLKITIQIDTQSTKHSSSLIGPSDILPNGKAIYQTYTGQSDSANKEIDFLSPMSSSADVIILVTLNGTLQGEWDGQVTIPS